MPLSAARRRHGTSLLILAAVGLCLVIAALFVQTPASLHAAVAWVALLLIVVCAGTGLVALAWVRMIVWPEERRRLGAATPVRRVTAVPAPADNRPRALRLLLLAGLLLAAFLWAFLSSVGLVGAPMLWLTVGTINISIARRIRRLEIEQNALYFASPLLPFLGARQDLFLFNAPAPGA